MNALIEHNKPELVRCEHTSWFIPVLSTWMREIQQDNFSTWTGLNTDFFRKHFSESMNPTLGHMHQQLKNIQYIKRQPTIIILAPETPLEPLPVGKNQVWTNKFDTSGKICTNLPGHLPILPNSGKPSYLHIVWLWQQCHTARINGKSQRSKERYLISIVPS